jgi:hypothetical protein
MYNNCGVDRYSLIFTQLAKEESNTHPPSPIPQKTADDQCKSKSIISSSIFLYSYLKHDIGPLLKKCLDALSTQPTAIVEKFEK